MNSSVSLPGSKKTYYSITLIGGTCVGKTSIQNKIIGKSINVHAPISTTVGVIDSKYETNYKGKSIVFHIQDTAGQEQYKSITKQFYKNCYAVIIVFSGDEVKSLKDVEHYARQFQVHYHNSKANQAFFPVCVIVRNKIDLPKSHFSQSDGFNVVKSIKESFPDFKGYSNLKFFETSALTGENIQELMNYIMEELDKQNVFDEINNKQSVDINKQNKLTNNSSKCC